MPLSVPGQRGEAWCSLSLLQHSGTAQGALWHHLCKGSSMQRSTVGYSLHSPSCPWHVIFICKHNSTAPLHRSSLLQGFLLILSVVTQASQKFTPVSKGLPSWQTKRQHHPDCWMQGWERKSPTIRILHRSTSLQLGLCCVLYTATGPL